MGDSLSAAYNISIAQSWPALLQQKLDEDGFEVALVNASISGETTVGGIARLPALLQKHQPTHMILELGGNDGLRGFSFRDTRRNLADMIRMAQDMGATVVLIGVRMPPNLGPVYNRRFQDMYQALADEYQPVYLPRFLEGIAASAPELMQDDGIHPTALAQPKLADKVYRKLAPVLPPA